MQLTPLTCLFTIYLVHPQIDLATEPRWPRICGTLGEDANLSAKMTKAYILDFKGDKLGATSVATIINLILGSAIKIKKSPAESGRNYTNIK